MYCRNVMLTTVLPPLLCELTESVNASDAFANNVACIVTRVCSVTYGNTSYTCITTHVTWFTEASEALTYSINSHKSGGRPIDSLNNLVRLVETHSSYQ